MSKKLLLVGVVAAVAFGAYKLPKLYEEKKEKFVAWLESKKEDSRESLLRDAKKDQIQVEKKIAQMRKDVDSLDGDIEKVKNELAVSIVKVRDLNNQTSKMRVGMETEHKGLVARGDELKDATERVKLGGVFVPVTEAKDRLKRDVDLHIKRKSQLDAMEKSLGHHERIRDTLEKQFDQMLRQKEELKAEIDAVEAEYKSLQLQQIESQYQTDDTRLAKVKENLRNLRTKLDVEKEKLKLTPKAIEGPSVGSAETVDEILAPLNGSKEKIGKTE